jgi:hypothetical protein
MRADETSFFIRQNTRPVRERVLEDDFPTVHGSSTKIGVLFGMMFPCDFFKPLQSNSGTVPHIMLEQLLITAFPAYYSPSSFLSQLW